MVNTGGLPFGSPPVLYNWRYSGSSERKFIVIFGKISLGARLGHNFFTYQKTAIFKLFLLKKGSILSIFQNCPRFKSNKRSHSGDNGDEPVPIPNTEVKLVYGEST